MVILIDVPGGRCRPDLNNMRADAAASKETHEDTPIGIGQVFRTGFITDFSTIENVGGDPSQIKIVAISNVCNNFLCKSIGWSTRKPKDIKETTIRNRP
jgi:hypothetical protein